MGGKTGKTNPAPAESGTESAAGAPEAAPGTAVADNVPAAESTADLDQIASGLADEMPAVQQHAIDQAQEMQKAAENSATDKTGAAFDPAVHVTGPDGKGVLTTRGTWAQKRGRKAGAANSVATGSTLAAPRAGAAASPAVATAEVQARAAGVMAAELIFSTGVIIGGDEWQPRKDEKLGLDERAMLQSAMGEYFVATGKVDIPPGLVLSFTILAYAAPRFTMPKTQSRFAAVKAKVAQWWMNRKLRKAGLTAEVRAAGEKNGGA